MMSTEQIKGSTSKLARLRAAGAAVIQFTTRWQESSLWMPMCIALAIGAWVVLGALDKAASTDVLPMVVVLPVKIAYATAALALTHLVRRRWRFRLNGDQQLEYWVRLQNGEKGPVIIFITDAVFTLCALYWLLQLFKLPS